MAAFKILNHVRSTSLPSSSHPLLASVEQHLDRLRSSEAASSSSHTSTCQNLDGLRNLYESLDDVLELPFSQQALFHKREDSVLDGSLRLLDICGAVSNIYSQLKETVQELESSLRRKRGSDLAAAYMISKKQLNKMICKCFKELRKAEKDCPVAVVNKDSCETGPLINLIKEIQQVSFPILKSTLPFIYEPKKGSAVSRLLKTKKVLREGESDLAGIHKLEAALHCLKNKKANQGKDILEGLEALDLGIQELIEVLEAVFRILLKTRASLLNILNQ